MLAHDITRCLGRSGFEPAATFCEKRFECQRFTTIPDDSTANGARPPAVLMLCEHGAVLRYEYQIEEVADVEHAVTMSEAFGDSYPMNITPCAATNEGSTTTFEGVAS